MDANTIALKLVLDAVAEPTEIGTVMDRLRLQKAIYLIQASGVNLGYSYSWYVRGPYSTNLTKDYYRLSDELRSSASEVEQYNLSPGLNTGLAKAKDILNKPSGVGLGVPNWYELLASIHYLMTYSRLDFGKMKELLSAEKPHLRDFIDVGYNRLRQCGYLS
ncbi:hypothetical protein GGR25_001213 [Kaistia hirudinis]|uniref:DUF4065 domain-containing protein n=1 Tax=Kaistia hirudinis TaxID=1293440 RepID=A0A840ALQ0_9HYPH|nr:hypothetical protein [Kaistia hirudinis]MBB3930174.1 hypothetical protein [Kaistia hirudinis]